MTNEELVTVPATMHWRVIPRNGMSCLLVYLSDKDISELQNNHQIHGHLQIPGFPEFVLVLQSDNMREFNDKSNLGLDD